MVRKKLVSAGGEPSPEASSESCNRARSAMGPFVDGHLGKASRRELERHVATCFACAGVLLRMRRRREAFNRMVRDTLAEGNAVPTKLREDVKVCLHCLTSPGSVRCPRLTHTLRLVPTPPEALQ